VISIGWRELGDTSSLDERELSELVDRTYTDAALGAKRLYCRMLRDFYHSVKPGDVVVARRGTKKIAAIGTVTRAAYYEYNKNAEAVGSDKAYSNHLDVQWEAPPQDRSFDAPVFGLMTIYEIPEQRFRELTQTSDGGSTVLEEGVQDRTEFVLEKYLEDFIISNFDAIFKGQLRLYSDAREGLLGQ
jgi:predicted Mrr-cat superfamily restriction endonuclease